MTGMAHASIIIDVDWAACSEAKVFQGHMVCCTEFDTTEPSASFPCNLSGPPIHNERADSRHIARHQTARHHRRGDWTLVLDSRSVRLETRNHQGILDQGNVRVAHAFADVIIRPISPRAAHIWKCRRRNILETTEIGETGSITTSM